MKGTSFIETTITKGIMWFAAWNRSRRKSSRPNPFLTGIYAPLKQEFTLDELHLTGIIPPELDGLYVRNGPNPITPPNPAVYQWFTGTGMVHGVRVQAGKALWYRNRWIRSTEVSEVLAETPVPGPRTDFDAPNTNVLGHAKAIWALVEAGGNPVRLDAELNTIAHDPFNTTLTHSFSAHPHIDPNTGEMHAVCYDGHELNCVWHVVVTQEGIVRREEAITVNHGPMIHDCMLTQHFVIILDLPVTFSMKRLLAGDEFPYMWNPKHPARVGLLPKEGKNEDVIWCSVSPCFVFHCANAYEAVDNHLILDVCVHDKIFAEHFEGPQSSKITFERWTINIKTKQVTRTVLDETKQEFPRINEQFLSKEYRYAYTVPYSTGAVEPGPLPYLIKHDLQEKKQEIHAFPAGTVPSEFVFVPKKESQSEDDGWLMGYVINSAEHTSALVILDAANFTKQAQAMITIPHQIPLGFHGNWVDVSCLKKINSPIP